MELLSFSGASQSRVLPGVLGGAPDSKNNNKTKNDFIYSTLIKCHTTECVRKAGKLSKDIDYRQTECQYLR